MLEANSNDALQITQTWKPQTFIDLFCGIGGFRIAAESLGWSCVFSSDIDEEVQRAYASNFGDKPYGDIHKISADMIPDHDLLFGGFPCQPATILRLALVHHIRLA